MMGHYTRHSIEEVSGFKNIETHNKETIAARVYDGMVVTLIKNGLEEQAKVLSNPFKSPIQYTIEDVVEYIRTNYDEDLESDEPSKWYTYKGDMKQVSLHFKDTLIKLHGVSQEEVGEIWDAWFLNGEGYMEMYELIAPVLDINKLK